MPHQTEANLRMGCYSITGLNLPAPHLGGERHSESLGQQHNTLFLAQARTWTAQCVDKGGNHKVNHSEQTFVLVEHLCLSFDFLLTICPESLRKVSVDSSQGTVCKPKETAVNKTGGNERKQCFNRSTFFKNIRFLVDLNINC